MTHHSQPQNTPSGTGATSSRRFGFTAWSTRTLRKWQDTCTIFRFPLAIPSGLIQRKKTGLTAAQAVGASVLRQTTMPTFEDWLAAHSLLDSRPPSPWVILPTLWLTEPSLQHYLDASNSSRRQVLMSLTPFQRAALAQAQSTSSSLPPIKLKPRDTSMQKLWKRCRTLWATSKP